MESHKQNITNVPKQDTLFNSLVRKSIKIFC